MDKLLLQSLSSDLKRITLSIQRNSLDSASRFNKEAKSWLKQSLEKSNDSSVRKILEKVSIVLDQKDDIKKAEDCLMYSVLLQNRSLKDEY